LIFGSTGSSFLVPRQRPEERRWVLSGDLDYDTTMKSRRHEQVQKFTCGFYPVAKNNYRGSGSGQAGYGPLPGYKKGPLVERSAGLFFCLMERPVYQGSAAPTPLGATLPDSVGGNLLQFLQLRSCDRRVSVSSSFPSQPSLGGSPLLRCQVALSLGTPATRERIMARCLSTSGLGLECISELTSRCSWHGHLQFHHSPT